MWTQICPSLPFPCDTRGAFWNRWSTMTAVNTRKWDQLQTSAISSPTLERDQQNRHGIFSTPQNTLFLYRNLQQTSIVISNVTRISPCMLPISYSPTTSTSFCTYWHQAFQVLGELNNHPEDRYTLREWVTWLTSSCRQRLFPYGRWKLIASTDTSAIETATAKREHFMMSEKKSKRS